MSTGLSETDKGLIRRWLAGWPASGHTLDDNRWYAFVDNHSREVGNVMSEAEVRQFIYDEETAKSGNVGGMFAKIIDKHISRAMHILYFLEATKR